MVYIQLLKYLIVHTKKAGVSTKATLYFIARFMDSSVLFKFLYAAHRGYISFVNKYVRWRHLISAKFVRSNLDYVRTQKTTDFKLCKYASISHKPVGIENGLYRFTASGTSHINQIGIL